MISFFPDPYPDELLYSVCARFADRVQYPGESSVVWQLFGTRNGAAVVDLPSRLGHLVASLPPGHNYTVDQLIDDHTLLPFYSPFCPLSRISQVREDMLSANGSLLYGRLGILVNQVPAWLQLCPLCAQEDIRQFGEYYWHRLHQVSGVRVCPVHAVFLVSSSVPFRHGRRSSQFISAQQSIAVCSPTRLDESNLSHQAFVRIARDAAWLLDQRQLSLELENLPYCYLKLLIERQLASDIGRVYVQQLNRAFHAFYGQELLAQLMCELDFSSYNHWLLRLTRFSSDKVQSPLHHLLLIHFLGHTVASFWQFQRDFFTRAQISTSPENTISIAADTLSGYRQKWLGLLATYPKIGLSFLRKNFGRIYIWLNRYDSQWLSAHLPQPLQRQATSPHRPARVDWLKRDSQLAAAVKELAQQMKDAPSRPVWLTKTAITRKLGCYTLIQKEIDKLPLTALVLSEVVETQVEYAIRRLEWATECFRRENIYPPRWQLLTRASLKPNTVALPCVQQAIEVALKSLSPETPESV